MFSRRFVSAGFVVVATIFVAVTYGSVVLAEHSWGSYHWARTTTDSFKLTVVNSTTSDWAIMYVPTALADWSTSGVVVMVAENGSTSGKVRRQCKAPSGKVRICNSKYGQNGWLGVAGISVDPEGHIVKGYTKLNDTYRGGPHPLDRYSSQLRTHA